MNCLICGKPLHSERNIDREMCEEHASTYCYEMLHFGEITVVRLIDSNIDLDPKDLLEETKADGLMIRSPNGIWTLWGNPSRTLAYSTKLAIEAARIRYLSY